MSKGRKVLLGLAAAILAGCATTTPPVKLTTIFNPDEVAFINEEGDNTINGSAFMRQRGGGVVTCAGSNVILIPSGAYAQERMNMLYGDITLPGFNPGRGGQIPPQNPEYWRFMRHTLCDAEGKFTFSKVSSGRYFIVTSVAWETFAGRYASHHGGALMHPVTFTGKGETVDSVLRY